ncbi:hypothetical protein IscW_ISCW023406 [Ixodes scapularis]|uniref:Uncharacterized protein n=1 Tax=Ixodes scapularis TaxID=6945 RepID=B7QLM2_IXOSC|nr:hypothetical protein IscW_ISCW023406 [Ixodes scapularis]|eukprot:XP_002416077.1 hypothetical protein IscW_ISCW023406 [Ixodes scapularis]
MDFRGYPLGTQHCPFRIKAREESVLTARFAFVRDPWPRLLGTWLPSVLAVFAAWMIPWFPEGGLFLPSAALLCVSLHTAHFKAQLQGKDLMTSFDIWLLLCTLLVLAAFLYGVLATSSRPKLWSVRKLMVETDAAPGERNYVAHGYKLTVDASTQTPLTAAAASDSRHRRLARRTFPIVFAANVVLFWTYVAFIANKGHL